MIFSARTQHESKLIERFHVVTGRFLTSFLPDTTPQTAYEDPSLRSESQRGQEQRGQEERDMVQDERVCRMFDLNER